jgi:hypothetical protein
MKGFLVVLTILFAISFAQNNEKHDPRAIIENVRIYRLTKDLDLTTEQAIEFFPRLNELQKVDREFRSKQQQILGELRILVQDSAPDIEIIETLTRYEDVFKDRVERQVMKRQELRKMLTPDQQARYLIFQDEFEREIKRMIQEVKRLHPR